jgi:protein TonB
MIRFLLFSIILLLSDPIATYSQEQKAPVQLPKGVKSPPEYLGGDYALQKYLTNEIRYPNHAKEDGVQGVILIAFVISSDGSITNPKIIKGKELGHGLPEEALRVIKKMPVWRPALNTKNKPAPFLYFQEVTFRLQ